MDHSVGVVVPTYNAAKTLSACLDSLLTQQHRPDQVLVVDGGSSDGTASVAEAKGVPLLNSIANRSAQRNLGASALETEFVLFVDADMLLSAGVVAECLARFGSEHAALVIPELSSGTTFWAKVRGFERSFYRGVWWMEAARWFRREQFLEVGGYDPALIGGEDWDLDQRIRSFGPVDRIQAVIVHEEGDATLHGLLGKKRHYATTLDGYARRHPARARLQFSLAPRASLFLGHPARLLRHPVWSLSVGLLGGLEWLAAHRPNRDDHAAVERPRSGMAP